MPLAGLDKTSYITTILDAIDDASAENPSIHTRLILSIDRRNSVEEAQEVVELAISFRDRGVVGIDLCGDPTKGYVILEFLMLASRSLENLNLRACVLCPSALFSAAPYYSWSCFVYL